jgi:hypothetical protein
VGCGIQLNSIPISIDLEFHVGLFPCQRIGLILLLAWLGIEKWIEVEKAFCVA